MKNKFIYPLWLRSKINFKLYSFFKNLDFNNVNLEFAPSVTLKLKSSDIGHKSLVTNGFYELELSKAIDNLSKKGGIMIDVGANYGYFTCLWAAALKTNKVHSFEASPINFPHFLHNVERNHFSNQVTCNHLAAGKDIGEMTFSLGPEDQTGWGGLVYDKEGTNGTTTVKVTTLDNYCLENSINEIEVLKIDVEGADTWVILGGEQLIKEKKIKNIFFEENEIRMKALGIEKNDALDFLKKFGYSIERISPHEFWAKVE